MSNDELSVNYIWLIDPTIQTLEADQQEQGRWLLIGSYAEQQSVSTAPFQEHTFSLSELWES